MPPLIRSAAILALVSVAAGSLSACSAQARAESCEEKAEQLRAAQDDNILGPRQIRRLRSQGCLNVSAFG